MKLKQYLSTKKLRRMVSKVSGNTKDSHGKLNESFEDFDKEIVTKDDLCLVNNGDGMLRLKRDACHGMRSNMTQSLINRLPSSISSQDTQTDFSPHKPERKDFSSQTNIFQRSASLGCETDSDIHDIVSYKDSINHVDLTNPLFCDTCNLECAECQCYWNYHSLPSNIQTHQQHQPLSQEIHYSSLPLSMTQSIYEDGKTQHKSSQPCDKWRRSRIKTNPWLPLPIDARDKSAKISEKESMRRENPRLSRFFTEVEQIMRAQCAEEEAINLTDSELYKYYSSSGSHTAGSSESLSSTNTATPDADLQPLRSPSEGYKSACSSSQLNLADTESLSDSRSSLTSDLSKTNDCSSPTSTSSTEVTKSPCPPSLQDFKANVSIDKCSKSSYIPSNSSHDFVWSSTTSLTESMFNSTMSSKSEALHDKVRKLCQSTSKLDEKMRLARMESQFIRV